MFGTASVHKLQSLFSTSFLSLTAPSSKFTGDTRLCGAADTLEGQDAIQRDLDRLDRWVNANLLKFNRVSTRSCGWVVANPGAPTGWAEK